MFIKKNFKELVDNFQLPSSFSKSDLLYAYQKLGLFSFVIFLFFYIKDSKSDYNLYRDAKIKQLVDENASLKRVNQHLENALKNKKNKKKKKKNRSVRVKTHRNVLLQKKVSHIKSLEKIEKSKETRGGVRKLYKNLNKINQQLGLLKKRRTPSYERRKCRRAEKFTEIYKFYKKGCSFYLYDSGVVCPYLESECGTNIFGKTYNFKTCYDLWPKNADDYNLLLSLGLDPKILLKPESPDEIKKG